MGSGPEPRGRADVPVGADRRERERGAAVNRFQVAQLQGGRARLRLPLSPVKADMALRALKNWREPDQARPERRWDKIANPQDDDGPTQGNIFDQNSWDGITP